MFAVSARFAHCRAIIRPLTRVFAIIFASLSAASWFRDEFASPSWQEKLKILELLPSWPWYLWLALMLVVVLLGVIEGSYRLQRDAVGDRLTIKPLATNIILQTSNGGPEPLRIIFWCSRTLPKLSVVLEYSTFANGKFWTKPRQIQIAALDGVINGQRYDLLLMFKEPNFDVRSGLHWGGPLSAGEPVRDLVHGGLYRARVRFVGHKETRHQNYYFFLIAFPLDGNQIRIEIIPDHDLSFVNEWELEKI